MLHYACAFCRVQPVNGLFLAKRNAELAAMPFLWPVNIIKIGRHVALLSSLAVYLLYSDSICYNVINFLQMNDTRLDWTRYNCNKVKEKNYNVLFLSGLFGFLTFIYYIAMRKHEKYKSRIQSSECDIFIFIS